MTRSILIALLFTLLSASSVFADNQKPRSERKQWMKEMRQFKHEFLIKELELTSEQQPQFFEVYDRMNEEIHALEKQTRQMERNIREKGNDVTDLEYEKAAEACCELPGKRNAITMRYFNEYKNILTKKQLFLLNCAERKFTNTIMHHRKNQAPKKHK